MHNLANSIGMQSLSPDQLNITSTGQYISITEQGGVYAAVFTGSYNAVSFFPASRPSKSSPLNFSPFTKSTKSSHPTVFQSFGRFLNS